MLREKILIETLESELKRISLNNLVVDKEIADELQEYTKTLLSDFEKNKDIDWRSFKSFWPPRIIEALRNDNLTCFFGAGVSIPSGLPGWSELLNNYFNINKKFVDDSDLKSDPLTLAEIASHQIGSEKLQSVLRNSFRDLQSPSTNHFLIAALRLPIYITTNYDNLFEMAWNAINPGIELKTILNDADLSTEFNHKVFNSTTRECSYLFKIHGSLSREDEHLILTRSDYRYHYRSNSSFFENIKKILEEFHTLFLGFSHKDPEVTRLVEDAIWTYESIEEKKQPHFYSLQFDMSSHTPEIFAARGIVALSPPPSLPILLKSEDYRSLSLGCGIIDLISASEKELDKKVSIDHQFNEISKAISNSLDSALGLMGKYEAQAHESLETKKVTWLKELLAELEELSNQGVYLLSDQGIIIDFEVPENIQKDDRLTTVSLQRRPYFQQAKTFRKPFVSDSFKSIYNELSTFFICYPITEGEIFKGLIFSAVQIGQWKQPIELAKDIWKDEKSFLLIDSNGTALLPPGDEFELHDQLGFKYDSLKRLSRRDILISRIMENVVPLKQDDDVLNLGRDLQYYTIVTELSPTRWKFGISTPIDIT